MERRPSLKNIFKDNNQLFIRQLKECVNDIAKMICNWYFWSVSKCENKLNPAGLQKIDIYSE
jgi:hypothetical protein